MRSSLSMAIPANDDRSEFHGVVLAAQRGCGQQKAQNLRISLGGPACKEVKQDEHQHTAEQAVEQVERTCAETHREKEEFSLVPEHADCPGKRTMQDVDPTCVRHKRART